MRAATCVAYLAHTPHLNASFIVTAG
jgi:hypothetical protein